MKKTKLSILSGIILMSSLLCAIVFLTPEENKEPIVKNTSAAPAPPMETANDIVASNEPLQPVEEQQPENQPVENSLPAAQQPIPPEKTTPQQQPEAQPTSAPKAAGMSIQIPKISLNAPVVTVGLEANGELHVPGNLVQAGWYKHSVLPGETGTSVITGHFDYGANFSPGVFYKLHNLALGDEVFVSRTDGSTAVFAVRAMEQYPQNNFPTAKVYTASQNPELRIITCAGHYSPATGRYTEDLVVYAALSRIIPQA